MVTPGHERWHPDPDFDYQPGGGPLLDMGPYYVTALVTILGSGPSSTRHRRREPHARDADDPLGRARRRDGPGRRRQPRDGRPDPRVGRDLDARHELRCGRLQGVADRDPRAAGVADRAGPEPVPRRRRAARAGWDRLGHAPRSAPGTSASSRGYGIAGPGGDPRRSEPRAGGALAFHVLDVMELLLESARTGRRVDVAEPLPAAGAGAAPVTAELGRGDPDLPLAGPAQPGATAARRPRPGRPVGDAGVTVAPAHRLRAPAPRPRRASPSTCRRAWSSPARRARRRTRRAACRSSSAQQAVDQAGGEASRRRRRGRGSPGARRCVAATRPSPSTSDGAPVVDGRACAPSRSVVATTLKFGYASATCRSSRRSWSLSSARQVLVHALDLEAEARA